MKKLLIISLLTAGFCTSGAPNTPLTSYTTVEEATRAHADFPLVGEYVSKNRKTALQVNMLKDRTFLVAIYKSGLPGDGGESSGLQSEKLTSAELNKLLSSYTKVARKSPTLGKSAPKTALLTMPDGFTNVKDGILMAGGKTTKDLSSFHMHLEFMQPFKPGRNPSNQDRGNSGIYIFNNYEIQIIDSFALDLNAENNAIELESINKQWCGALYKMKLPDIHMAYPPLRWQTYDIDFQAPEFNAGKKIKNARLTVLHNGVLIHDDVELKTGTGAGARKKQLAKGPVFFQEHANPVMFRNVWITGLK